MTFVVVFNMILGIQFATIVDVQAQSLRNKGLTIISPNDGIKLEKEEHCDFWLGAFMDLYKTKEPLIGKGSICKNSNDEIIKQYNSIGKLLEAYREFKQ